MGFEYRLAEGRNDRLAPVAAELVRLKVSVIVAPTPIELKAVMKTTQTIPIVMVAVGNPATKKGDGPTIVTGWMIVELVMNLALLVRALRLLIDIADSYLFTLSMWECRGLSMHSSGGGSWLPGVWGGMSTLKVTTC